jgi:hypothetical protein
VVGTAHGGMRAVELVVAGWQARQSMARRLAWSAWHLLQLMSVCAAVGPTGNARWGKSGMLLLGWHA